MSHHGKDRRRLRISLLARHPARLIQQAFEQGHNGMVLTDAEGHVLLANAAFCRITGCERSEVTGWPIEHFFVSLSNPTLLGKADPAGGWQQEVLCRRRDGESLPILMTVDALSGDDGKPLHFLRTFVNLATHEGEPSSVHHWVHVDPMTGLPNWLLLRDRLSHALAQADRTGHGLALLFIDIDRFKAVNDAVGHLEGDRLLGELARRMQGALRSKDTLARLGGDEFIMILEHNGSAEAAQAVAERLQEALEPPFITDNRQLLLTASVGIALFPFDAKDEEGLINVARGAMYTARKKGPGRLAFVDHRLTTQLKEKLRLEYQLSEAAHLPERHFEVHYQPELDPSNGRCIGLEAKVYWRQPQQGLCPPADLREVVNRLGLGVRLDRWALQRVIADHRRWEVDGSRLGRLPVTITLSERHLAHNTFDGRPLDHFLRQQHQPSLEWLTLAIPGHSLGPALDEAAHMLKRLVALDVHLAVDELGGGPVDLPCLARLPLERARFRASLARGSHGDGRPLAKPLCRLLESMGIDVIATHADAPQDAEAIETLPLHGVQGDHYCRPMPRSALEQWLTDRSSA